MGKTICFVNNKGGCGKTTTVCAVGQAWAELGKKILFVDLDSQSNLTCIITDTDPSTKEWEQTLEDAFVGGPDYGLPIEHVSENIDIIPSDLDLSNFERETARYTGREFLLADLLETVKENYDYILIDCPPALSLITYNALVASDYMVMVTNAEGLSYRGMKMVANLYNEVAGNKRLREQQPVELLPGEAPERARLDAYPPGRQEVHQDCAVGFLPAEHLQDRPSGKGNTGVHQGCSRTAAKS